MRVEIEVGEFLVVSGRGVVEDCAFQVVDALVPWNPAEGQTGRCDIGTRFDDEINEGAEGPKEDDDVNPIGRRPPPYIVEDRHDLENEAPGIEEVAEKSHLDCNLL